MQDWTLKDAFDDAERRARKRDIDSRLDIDTIARELQKAADNNIKVVHYTPRNPAGFVQVIADNLNYLVSRDYLTSAEMAFLLSILGLVEMHSNALVDEQGQYMTLTKLAETTKYSLRNVRRAVSSLLEKGIIYEFVDAQQFKQFGRIVEERPLFMNPEVVFCGDRNKVNATLCRLVINADTLERKKICLPWKLWIDSGSEYGRLYRRSSWLKKRKGR